MMMLQEVTNYKRTTGKAMMTVRTIDFKGILSNKSNIDRTIDNQGN